MKLKLVEASESTHLPRSAGASGYRWLSAMFDYQQLPSSKSRAVSTMSSGNFSCYAAYKRTLAYDAADRPTWNIVDGISPEHLFYAPSDSDNVAILPEIVWCSKSRAVEFDKNFSTYHIVVLEQDHRSYRDIQTLQDEVVELHLRLRCASNDEEAERASEVCAMMPRFYQEQAVEEYIDYLDYEITSSDASERKGADAKHFPLQAFVNDAEYTASAALPGKREPVRIFSLRGIRGEKTPETTYVLFYREHDSFPVMLFYPVPSVRAIVSTLNTAETVDEIDVHRSFRYCALDNVYLGRFQYVEDGKTGKVVFEHGQLSRHESVHRLGWYNRSYPHVEHAPMLKTAVEALKGQARPVGMDYVVAQGLDLTRGGQPPRPRSYQTQMIAAIEQNSRRLKVELSRKPDMLETSGISADEFVVSNDEKQGIMAMERVETEGTVIYLMFRERDLKASYVICRAQDTKVATLFDRNGTPRRSPLPPAGPPKQPASSDIGSQQYAEMLANRISFTVYDLVAFQSVGGKLNTQNVQTLTKVPADTTTPNAMIATTFLYDVNKFCWGIGYGSAYWAYAEVDESGQELIWVPKGATTAVDKVDSRFLGSSVQLMRFKEAALKTQEWIWVGNKQGWESIL